MEVIRANQSHKAHVLRLLDDFRTVCSAIIDPDKRFVSDSAVKLGGPIFDEVVMSANAALFLIREQGEFVGIVTVYKVPQIRKGTYCAEIEELFVEPQYQGKGAGTLLLDAVIQWSEEEKLSTIRLESSNLLSGAHAFYEKAGFKQYGKAFERTEIE
jgi:GNAT superfamily N-acetyltransferase